MNVEGKTKIVEPGPKPHLVKLVTKDTLSAGDAAKIAEVNGIGRDKTDQAANVFSLLKRAGVPVAFVKKSDDRSLLCEACEMFPLEIVIRRYPWGSYFKRHPARKDTMTREGKPRPFGKLIWEVFHKDAVVVDEMGRARQMKEAEARAAYMKNGQWMAPVHTDPYIDPEPMRWNLYKAKEPLRTTEPLMSVDPVIPEHVMKYVLNGVVISVFTVLEKAWRTVSVNGAVVHLADAKFEVGRQLKDGKIVLADVIDNDCWRIWPGGDPAKQLDKQNFRDGSPLEKVADSYTLVTELTRRFQRADLVLG